MTTIQSSDIYHPLGARKLLARQGNQFDLDGAAEQIVSTLAKFDLTQMVRAQNPQGIGMILINPQVVDMSSMTVVEVGRQFTIPVQDYDDVSAIKAALPELLPALEEKLSELPSGLRLEVVVGVSGSTPRTRITPEQVQAPPSPASHSSGAPAP